MGRLAGFSGREVARVAERSGWAYQRTRGDDMIYAKAGQARNLSVPAHRELKEGITRALIATMEMTVDEFLAIARK